LAVLGLQTGSFGDILKTRYLDPINDEVVRAHVLLDRLEKNSEDVSGEFAHIPLIAGRNPAVGSRTDTAGGGPKLPAHGAQTYDRATFTMGLHYGRGSVSGAIRRKSRDKAGAFAEALDLEMKGLMQSLPDDLNRQVCSLGNGRAATFITTQADSSVLLCDNRDQFTLKVGDRVHHVDITDANDWLPLAGGATVSDIAFDTAANTNTVTLSATIGDSMTPAAGALYFGGGGTANLTAEDSSHGQEIYGIPALVDDGDVGADETIVTEATEMLTASVASVGGITRSSSPFWQAKVYHNPVSAGTRRPLTQKILFEAHLYATAQGGANPKGMELYMSPSIWGTLGMIQVGSRIYNDYKKTVEMGWEYIEVNGSKAFYDRDLPRFCMFYLNMESIFLLTQGGYEMIDDDGNVLRVIAGGGRDAWEFSIQRDCQVGIKSGRRHVRVNDIEETMTVLGATH